MILKRWAVFLFSLATLALVANAALPARAEEGKRLPTQIDVLWLGALSTGYVVGTHIEPSEYVRLEYMKVPIRVLRIVDALSGETLWEGKPYIGQEIRFHENTHVKFIAYSGTGPGPGSYPNPATPAVTEYAAERPVLDAMQFKILNR